MNDTSTDVRPDPTPGITLYWRPGCGFCSRLRAGLHRAGVPVREIDIWNDDAARAFVRSVAGGNETVPTLTIGTVSVVNPSLQEVIELARVELPELVIEPEERSGIVRSLFSRPRADQADRAVGEDSRAHSGASSVEEERWSDRGRTAK